MTNPRRDTTPDLTVLVRARNDAGNIREFVDGVRVVCRSMGVSEELVLIDVDSTDDTVAAAEALGARIVRQAGRGYGETLLEGFRVSRGEWVVTMDADLSHRPQFLESLWAKRHESPVVVASRYVPAGFADMPAARRWLSRAFNLVFSALWSVPVRDLSSGFRLYRRDVLASLEVRGTGYDVLPEILVELYNEGYSIREVPFYYRPRRRGVTSRRLLSFGWSQIKTFRRLWVSRNSINAADYDFRAFYSRHPFQRYWQRRRFRIITTFIDRHGDILDAGCGSGVFACQFPRVTALDLSPKKVRFVGQFNTHVTRASSAEMPFEDGRFTSVVSSQVIEHTLDERILPECVRVLAPGGTLVVGTPDYGSWEWPLIERIYQFVHPQGYADEHVNRYTRERLLRTLEDLGVKVVAVKAILNAELIVKAVKPAE